MKKYQIKIIDQLDDAFIADWIALWNRSEHANVFNSYEWFQTCLEIEKIATYRIYACFKEEKLVAVLPLTRYMHFGIPVLGSLLNKYQTETPFLIENYDKELFKHFFANLMKENIFLQKIDNSATILIKKYFPKTFFTLMSVNPIISLSEDPFAQTSKSTKKTINKIIRDNQNSFRFVGYKENLLHYLKEMYKLEAKSSKKLHAMDIFSKPETRKLFESMVKNSNKLARIYFLYYNNVPIAYQYGYEYKETFLCDQIAYNNDYAKFNPGKTILFYLLENLKVNNIKLVDFGGGISSYKREFTQEYRILYNMYYSPNVLVLSWWKAINLARRLKQILRPLKNTRDHEFLFKQFRLDSGN